MSKSLSAASRAPTAPVSVVGAGGHAKVVVATLQALGVEVAGIYDDRNETWGSHVLGVIVRGPIASLAPHTPAVLAMGDNRTRKKLASELAMRWQTVVHPAAWVHESVCSGEGTVVFAGAIVQPDTTVGAHCILNTGASVDHDCALADFVHVAPGVHLCGAVNVGEGAMLGVGAAVIPGRTIGAWSTLGAGSVCVRDIEPGVLAYGSPARAGRPGVP